MLDELFSSSAGPERTIRIERLEIDLERINPDTLEFDLTERLRKKMAEALADAIREEQGPQTKATPPGKTEGGNDILDALEIFLRTGSLPWWATDHERFDPDGETRALLQGRPAQLIERLRTVGPRAAPRILRQLRSETVTELLEVLGSSLGAVTPVEEELTALVIRMAASEESYAGLPPRIREAFLHRLLSADATTLDDVAIVSDVLHRIAESEEIAFEPMAARLRELGGTMLPEHSPLLRVLKKIAGISAEGRADTRQKAQQAKKDKGREDQDTPHSADQADAAEKHTGRVKAGAHDISADPSKEKERASVEADKKDAASPQRPGAKKHEQGKEQEERDRDAESVAEGTTCYIDNAGLVLLHPFLGRFFKTLDLFDEGAFLSPEHQERGAALTQYLVTGETGQSEHLLLLNKLLCGIPAEQPIERFIQCSDRERKEAGELLHSVIEHWSALKNTSVEGLRQAFLQREGRLRRNARGWHLLVERRPYDMLLERLPWSIGIIRNKWMNQPIYVEW